MPCHAVLCVCLHARQRGSGWFGRWRKHYFALWDGSLLYRFPSEKACQDFFNGTGSFVPGPDDVVDLDSVVCVQPSSQSGLPSRGLELLSIDGQRVLCSRLVHVPRGEVGGEEVGARLHRSIA